MDTQHHIIDWRRLQAAKDQLHRDCPQLAQEIERGTQLVTEANVRQTGGNSWQVYDPATHDVRTVLFTLDWSCDCGRQNGVAFFDWFCGGWQPVCCHIAAAALYWLACTPVKAKGGHDKVASGHVLAGMTPVEVEATCAVRSASVHK